MSRARVFASTALAMLAFAANSLLCRLALRDTEIDAASFTTLRLASGAAVLWMLVQVRAGARSHGGGWAGALALFVYAAGFSLAYRALSTASGALLLFGAVQLTMIAAGLMAGERLGALRWSGLAAALGGLAWLLMPGLSAPAPMPAAAMLAAGIAWGAYSLLGRGSPDPIGDTAGHFSRALLPALALSAVTLPGAALDAAGAGYALASGALASGLGYALWYTVLPALRRSTAASAQLCVPLLAALGGALFAGEAPTPRLIVAAAAILGGIALTVFAAHIESARPGPRS